MSSHYEIRNSISMETVLATTISTRTLAEAWQATANFCAISARNPFYLRSIYTKDELVSMVENSAYSAVEKLREQADYGITPEGFTIGEIVALRWLAARNRYHADVDALLADDNLFGAEFRRLMSNAASRRRTVDRQIAGGVIGTYV